MRAPAHHTMHPQVFSAVIAITSVSINLYGGLITEKRRAELAREVRALGVSCTALPHHRAVPAASKAPMGRPNAKAQHTGGEDQRFAARSFAASLVCAKCAICTPSARFCPLGLSRSSSRSRCDSMRQSRQNPHGAFWHLVAPLAARFAARGLLTLCQQCIAAHAG